MNERIGKLGASLSAHIQKMDIAKGNLSKEVIALNWANSNAFEDENSKVKENSNHQKTNKEYLKY